MQVYNLQSCVRVTEDFISAEHLGTSLALLRALRHEPESGVNYEDKLQVRQGLF